MKLSMPLFLVLLFSFGVQAQSGSPNYPELMVVPKASERLNIEASRSDLNGWSNFLPLHVAATTTLTAGILTLNDLDKDHDSAGIYPKIAIAVGAGWLATSVWLHSSYRPYYKSFQEVKKINGQTTRVQLAAERMAEEHINQIATLGKKIKWLSFFTNAGASALTIGSAKSDSAAKGTAFLGTLTSFLPLLFPLSWEQVSEDQQSYKKKIFGPVSFSNGLIINPANQKPSMGMYLTTYFN